MLRLGLVGLGWHGQRYAGHLAKGEVPGLSLAALCRRDAAKGVASARELGCVHHESVEALASDPRVDALLIVSPGALHPEHVRAGLRARKPILVEKPLAHSLEEAANLVKETRVAGGRVMVAHTLRWEPVFERALAAAREIGPVRTAQALFLKGDFGKRASSETLPGDHHRAIFNCGIHHLDLAGLVFPDGFERAFAVPLPGRGASDLGCLCLLEAKGGGTFALTLRLEGEGSLETLTVLGDRGTIAGDRTHHVLTRISSGASTPLELPPRAPSLTRVITDFRDFVEGRIENPVPLEAAARAVARAEACVRSLESGGPVAVQEDLT